MRVARVESIFPTILSRWSWRVALVNAKAVSSSVPAVMRAISLLITSDLDSLISGGSGVGEKPPQVFGVRGPAGESEGVDLPTEEGTWNCTSCVRDAGGLKEERTGRTSEAKEKPSRVASVGPELGRKGRDSVEEGLGEIDAALDDRDRGLVSVSLDSIMGEGFVLVKG